MQTFDLSKLAPTEPSLVLPYVYSNVSSERIASAIEELEFGEIERIDRLEKINHKTGQPFDVVFVHFSAWNTSTAANGARQHLLNKRDAKIYYDDNWFWKARAYVPKVRTPPPAPTPAPKARIEFGDAPADPPTELKCDSAAGFKWTPPKTTEVESDSDSD